MHDSTSVKALCLKEKQKKEEKRKRNRACQEAGQCWEGLGVEEKNWGDW